MTNGSRRSCRGEDADVDEVLATILNTTICRALAFFDFALETGERNRSKRHVRFSTTAVSLADNAENVPLWWITNLCRHLIDDLWQHSLHQNLPTEPPDGAAGKYPDLRQLVHWLPLRPKNFRGGAVAIAARGGAPVDGRQGRSRRRPCPPAPARRASLRSPR